MLTTLTIPRNLTHGDELVVLPRKEYEKLQKRLEEARDALAKIAHGEKELKNGKTKVTFKSLAELRAA